jgi:phosphohistidine phosphatase
MRRLSLLRHAKSSWDEDSLDDFHRPLNDRGRRNAKAMGKRLNESGARFDLILASPAERVVQTIAGLKAGGWEHGPVRFEKRIYDASVRDLLDLIGAVPDDVQSLLLVGHNPAIGIVAQQLVRPEGEHYSELRQDYPTGTLANMELEIGTWNELGPACGRLVEFTVPRSLPEA